MPFPEHIERVLSAYGVAAATKAALFDLYVSMGDEVLEVFADIAERSSSTASLTPEDTVAIREQVVERYLTRNHPRWVEGQPTASLWHPREMEGRASGAAIPLGDVAPLAARVLDGEHPPEGFLMHGRNAHFGGRADTISFDVVANGLSDAIAIGLAKGQQHTLPGSVGETSGTYCGDPRVALIWEVQPNVYKPAGERNRNVAKLYRQHRNWHVLTLCAALEWLRERQAAVFILRGNALAIAHEVNPAKPVSADIASMHDRTVARAVAAVDMSLIDVDDDDEFTLLEAGVMNHALRQHVLRHGSEGLIWRVQSRAVV